MGGSSNKPFIIAKNPGAPGSHSAVKAPGSGTNNKPTIDPKPAVTPAPENNPDATPPAENTPQPVIANTTNVQKDPQRPAKNVGGAHKALPDPPVVEDNNHLEAQTALDTFLRATSIEERLRFVHAPEKIEEAMEDYYGRHPQAIEPDRIEFQLANKLRDSQMKFFVFEVTTKQQRDPFPVSVEETAEGYKFDWRLFIEFHDNLLGRFIKIYQQKPEQFRVMLERAHYFRSDVPDLGNKLCFRIRPPMLGYEGYAFIDADSPLGKELEDKFDWDVLYMPIVELQWVNVDGWKFIKLTKVVQDNWRTAF